MCRIICVRYDSQLRVYLVWCEFVFKTLKAIRRNFNARSLCFPMFRRKQAQGLFPTGLKTEEMNASPKYGSRQKVWNYSLGYIDDQLLRFSLLPRFLFMRHVYVIVCFNHPHRLDKSNTIRQNVLTCIRIFINFLIGGNTWHFGVGWRDKLKAKKASRLLYTALMNDVARFKGEMGNGATAQFSISSGLFLVSCGSRTVVSRWVTVFSNLTLCFYAFFFLSRIHRRGTLNTGNGHFYFHLLMFPCVVHSVLKIRRRPLSPLLSTFDVC